MEARTAGRLHDRHDRRDRPRRRGGYLISRVALQAMVYWAPRTMPVDLGDPNLDIAAPAADWRVAVFLVVAAMAATAFFALVPALQATRIDPMRTLRGELVRKACPGRARNGLIVVQVFASPLLLICAAIFLRSALASSRFDLGMRTADAVPIDIANEPKRTAMVQAMASESTIATFAGIRPGMLAWPHAAFAAIGGSRTQVFYKFVSPEYFEVFDISIVRGRSFTAAERRWVRREQKSQQEENRGLHRPTVSDVQAGPSIVPSPTRV